LKKFHTDFIDIYQMSGIRRVDAVERALRPDGALQALIKAKRQGKIGHIGVTGHSPDALVKAINSGEIECCQFVLNLAVRQSLKELIPVAKEQNVDLFVMRPLEDGWLKSQAQMDMRFLFSSPVDVVISGMYTKDVIDTNIALAESEPRQDEWSTLLRGRRAFRLRHAKHVCSAKDTGSTTTEPRAQSG
jgi:predicted aldo/keto reductase-like oxidoreductase